MYMEIDALTYSKACNVPVPAPNPKSFDYSVCPNGNTSIQSYFFKADALHYEEAYSSTKRFNISDCTLAVKTSTSNTTILSCITAIGPSILLLNYEPHVLTASLQFESGFKGDSTRYTPPLRI